MPEVTNRRNRMILTFAAKGFEPKGHAGEGYTRMVGRGYKPTIILVGPDGEIRADGWWFGNSVSMDSSTMNWDAVAADVLGTGGS